jgi:hypothetical protein
VGEEGKRLGRSTLLNWETLNSLKSSATLGKTRREFPFSRQPFEPDAVHLDVATSRRARQALAWCLGSADDEGEEWGEVECRFPELGDADAPAPLDFPFLQRVDAHGYLEDVPDCTLQALHALQSPGDLEAFEQCMADDVNLRTANASGKHAVLRAFARLPQQKHKSDSLCERLLGDPRLHGALIDADITFLLSVKYPDALRSAIFLGQTRFLRPDLHRSIADARATGFEQLWVDLGRPQAKAGQAILNAAGQDILAPGRRSLTTNELFDEVKSTQYAPAFKVAANTFLPDNIQEEWVRVDEDVEERKRGARRRVGT